MVKIQEKIVAKISSHSERVYQVVLFDCTCHMFDEVVLQLTRATGCSDIKAVQYANIAEQFGCVAVFTGSLIECNKVITILTATGLNATVQ